MAKVELQSIKLTPTGHAPMQKWTKKILQNEFIIKIFLEAGNEKWVDVK